MSIVSFNVSTTGQVGFFPRICELATTDNLAAITTAGYLNRQGGVLQGFNFYPTDVIFINYSYVVATNSGTFGIFLPSIGANGQITLAEWANPGDVLLPVVSGDFAVFNGTSGQIKDAGYLPTNAAKTDVVMANGAVVSGNLAQFVDTAGTIDNSGIPATGLQILSASVSMNQAAVQGAFATPFQIVAPTAGKVIVPVQATVYTNFQTSAFATGGVAILQYDSTVHGAGTNALAATIPAAEVTAASSQIYSLEGAVATALTGITNKGLYFSNQTQGFTGGSASSTVVVTVSYYLVTATV